MVCVEPTDSEMSAAFKQEMQAGRNNKQFKTKTKSCQNFDTSRKPGYLKQYFINYSRVVEDICLKFGVLTPDTSSIKFQSKFQLNWTIKSAQTGLLDMSRLRKVPTQRRDLHPLFVLLTIYCILRGIM